MCRIERKDAELTIHADDELKLKQMHELLKGIWPTQDRARRLEYKTAEKAAGQSVRQMAEVKNGIDKDLAQQPGEGYQRYQIEGSGGYSRGRISRDRQELDDLQAVIAI